VPSPAPPPLPRELPPLLLDRLRELPEELEELELPISWVLRAGV